MPFIFVLVLDYLENEKQEICVLLAAVKYEHGLVPLRFRDFFLETATAWKCPVELLEVAG